MSGLPKYTRTPDHESGETDSLVKGGKNSFDESVPLYPPRAGPSTSGGHNVTYTFIPRYPIKGTKKHVMGVLGRTKEETIDVVRRAFPELEQYPDERFEFEVGIDGSKEDWGGLMEDAWTHFATQPPSRMKVQVADGPGDAKRRQKRELLTTLALIFGPLSAMLMLFALTFFITSYIADDF